MNPNRHILTTPIQFFRMADAGGGGAAAAPVIEAAPAAATPNAEVNADIVGFDPGPIDFDAAGIPKGADDAPPAPPAPKPPVTPPTPKPNDTPPAKPTNEPPIKLLRDELAATKAERDTLKATLEKGDPRLVEAEKKVTAAQAELAESKKRQEDYERKLAIADPAVTKRLTEMDAGYNASATKFYQAVPELSPKAVQDFMFEYHALPFGTPEYAAARAAFDAKVNTALGGSDDREHRKLNRAIDFIEATRDHSLDRAKVAQEINNDALKLKHQADVGEFTSKIEFVRKGIEVAKTMPEGLATREPYHPKVVLDSFLKTLPEDQLKKIDQGIPEFIELAMSGVKPFDAAEYAGMTPEQIKESQAEHAERHEEARKNLVSVAFNGLRSMRIIPALVKEIQRLRGEKKAGHEETPPNPAGGGADSTNPGGADDLKTYTPPPIPGGF